MSRIYDFTEEELKLPIEKLANTPDKAGVSRGYFAVPKVMEGD